MVLIHPSFLYAFLSKKPDFLVIFLGGLEKPFSRLSKVFLWTLTLFSQIFSPVLVIFRAFLCFFFFPPPPYTGPRIILYVLRHFVTSSLSHKHNPFAKFKTASPWKCFRMPQSPVYPTWSEVDGVLIPPVPCLLRLLNSLSGPHWDTVNLITLKLFVIILKLKLSSNKTKFGEIYCGLTFAIIRPTRAAGENKT